VLDHREATGGRRTDVAKLEIRIFGDPVLRQRAHEVEDFDDRLVTLAQDMLDTMRDANGVGLAANQVGVLKRLFTWEVAPEDEDPIGGVVVNPVLLDSSAEVQQDEEGCLSFPGLFYPVDRPLRIEVTHQDLSGDEHTVELEGYLARIWLHEMDHLNGILFIDHLAKHDRQEALRRMRTSSARTEGSDEPRPRWAAAGRGRRTEVRIAFLGTPEVAVPALEALLAADDVEVAVVVTNPDRPRGGASARSPRPSRSPPRPPACRSGSRRSRSRSSTTCGPRARRLRGGRLRRHPAGRVLAAGGRGFVNLHFSLLPRWRGAAPVQHALRAGDTVTGVTTFVLDPGMDTGPVLRTAEVAIDPDESAGELLARLAVLGAPVLVDAIRDLVAGVEPTPQPDDGVTLAPKITPDDVRIDWTPRPPRWPTSSAARIRRPAPTRPSGMSPSRSSGPAPSPRE
jgi:peptide deformylase